MSGTDPNGRLSLSLVKIPFILQDGSEVESCMKCFLPLGPSQLHPHCCDHTFALLTSPSESYDVAVFPLLDPEG